MVSEAAGMQITITVPDDVAVQARAHGVSIEAYVGQLIEQARSKPEAVKQPRTREQIESFFSAMAEGSDQLPTLPTESFSRESFYEDHA